MPPKKGKGKKKKGSGKLSKMTEEERMLYLEQQRLAEEEFRKQREDFLSAYLQGKIGHEEKFSKLNQYKLNHQWRNIMREVKSKELKRDIEVLSQTFERVVDRKESVLKSLVKDIEEADEQLSLAVRAHLQNVDRLIDIQNRRVSKLTSEYQAEKEAIRSEFVVEESCVRAQHDKDMKDLQDVLYGLEESFLEKEVESRAEFQSMRDEIKNKSNEEKHSLKLLLDARVEEYWRQFNEAKKGYHEATRDKKAMYDDYVRRDEKSSAEIERQMRMLQKIGAQIAGVKQKMALNSKTYDERNQMLKEEREKMMLHFQQLKAQMTKIREVQRQKLTKMTLESNGAMKELKRQGDKAEKILRLGEMCRRLETEEEKVLPFPATSLTPEELEDVAVALKEEANEPLAAGMRRYQNLDEFWRRFNKATLDKLALDKEKSVLMTENGQLRSLLKQYLDGVSVSDEILGSVNPLVVINGRSNVNLKPPLHDPRVRAAPTVAVEGNLEVRSKRL